MVFDTIRLWMNIEELRARDYTSQSTSGYIGFMGVKTWSLVIKERKATTVLISMSSDCDVCTVVGTLVASSRHLQQRYLKLI